MKTHNNYLFYTCMLLVSFSLGSCLKEDAFETPRIMQIPPEIDLNKIVSIGALHSLWLQNTEGEGVYTLEDAFSDKYLEGFVISSDEAGNFFEELYLQDRPENPQYGIKLLLDTSPLFTRFNFGRRVFVKLDGLSLGMNSGVFTLGLESSNEIRALSEAQINAQLIRDTLVTQIIPRAISVSHITPASMNLYLRLNNVQFHRSQLEVPGPLTFAGEPEDGYDGERLLESCSDHSIVYFSTSSFANFKEQTLGGGQGFIDGIAMFDYYGEHKVFSVNGIEDIHLQNETRCDPETLVCEGEFGGTQIIWEADFETMDNLNDLLSEGWVSISPLEGNTTWEVDSFSGNTYLKISGYNTGEPIIESWLVSPLIYLTNFEHETLNLEVQSSYDNGATLTIMVSTDYQSNPLEATWQELDLAIPPGPYEGFGDVIQIGPVSLSCLEGYIALAFVYNGSDPFKTTRFHIDNIKIKGN